MMDEIKILRKLSQDSDQLTIYQQEFVTGCKKYYRKQKKLSDLQLLALRGILDRLIKNNPPGCGEHTPETQNFKK